MASHGEKAGFWVRLPAVAIDSAIGGVVFGLLRRVFGFGASSALSMVIGLAYYVFFWTTSGQTLGHRALGLKVVGTDGGSLTVPRATTRYFGYFFAALPFGLGLFWAGWDANKQGLHDKLADSYVIKT